MKMRKPLNVPPREEILPEYIVKQSEEICKSLKQLRFRKIALLQAVGEQNRCALSVCNNILILVVQFRQLGNIVCCVFLIDRRVGSIRLHSASAMVCVSVSALRRESQTCSSYSASSSSSCSVRCSQIGREERGPGIFRVDNRIKLSLLIFRWKCAAAAGSIIWSLNTIYAGAPESLSTASKRYMAALVPVDQF